MALDLNGQNRFATVEILHGRAARADYYAPDTMMVFLRIGEQIDWQAIEMLITHNLWEAELAAQGMERINSKFAWGTFRGATAVVEKVESQPSTITINGVAFELYFANAPAAGLERWKQLLAICGVAEAAEGNSFIIQVRGSSPDTLQQIKAVTHAVANVVGIGNTALKADLNRAGFGGRHPRRTERSL